MYFHVEKKAEVTMILEQCCIVGQGQLLVPMSSHGLITCRLGSGSGVAFGHAAPHEWRVASGGWGVVGVVAT